MDNDPWLKKLMWISTYQYVYTLSVNHNYKSYFDGMDVFREWVWMQVATTQCTTLWSNERCNNLKNAISVLWIATCKKITLILYNLTSTDKFKQNNENLRAAAVYINYTVI